MTRLFLLALLFFAAAPAALAPRVAAQTAKVLRGDVRDAETSAPLPAATVQVEGTFRGTIANAEGRYELRVDSLPATIVVRYIGYETVRHRVTATSAARQDVALRPATLEMDALVVTGESGTSIMRKVITRKQARRARLRTYGADAYNRFTLSNDTGIVSIAESLTRLFWDEERGTREIVKSRRQTANLKLEQFLPAGLFVTNLYDDDIEVGGYTLVGVTSPDALSHYDFEIEGTRALDGRRVYDLRVRPKSRLKSAFVGTVAVLEGAWALLEADLRPGRAFLFPPPVEALRIAYRQQFSDFGKDVWLPVSFRSHTEVEVALPGLLRVPKITIDQVSRLSNYAVNVPLPDSLYENESYLAVDSAAVQRGTLLSRMPQENALQNDTSFAQADGAAVPLSAREETAFASIDSTMTLEKAYAPTGLLVRFLELGGSFNDEEGGGVGGEVPAGEGGGGPPLDLDYDLIPQVWFNGVDALNAALKVRLRAGEQLALTGLGGYKTGLRTATYGGELSYELGRRTTLRGAYHYGTEPRYHSRLYGRLFNSLNVLAGGDDYFDYYGSERVSASVSRRFPGQVRVEVGALSERSFPVRRTTSYDVFGTGNEQPPNPPVQSGFLRSAFAEVTIGDEEELWPGLSGQKRLHLAVEHSFPKMLESDFDFTRFTGAFDYAVPTFFRRRLLPNQLDVRLTGGTFIGTLPLQRFGLVEASRRPLTAYGALHTLAARPYEGEQYAVFIWEHNFRTVPFEAVGLYGLAQRGWSLLLHGGHGRTWLAEDRRLPPGYVRSAPGGLHHEFGVALNGILGVLRLDFTARLDRPGFVVGLSTARLF